MSGGPDGTAVVLNEHELAETLEPYIADAPKARALFEANQTQTNVSMGLYLGGALAFLGSGILSAVMSLKEDESRFGGPANLTGSWQSDVGVLSAFLGSGLALWVASAIVQPSQADWIDVIRTYNEERPDTAWSAPELGIVPVPLNAEDSVPGLATAR